MASLRSIITEIDDSNGWDRLFRRLQLTATGYDLPCCSANLPENWDRNRYRDVSPYDHSRVKLMEGANDYINSSLVEVPSAERKYILAQGPLGHTSGHFWQMVWEQNSAAVIMLNRVIEKGTIKCSQYFSLDEKPLEFPDAGFTVTTKRQQVNPNYTVRYLDLKKNGTNNVKEIYQFHYTAWPDFGVPESPEAFLSFLNCVKDCGVLEKNVGPAVIHCSAGIGRSGTFALVDSCLIFIERGIAFDVIETLLEMRKYRMGLIQTAQQLRFSYCAITEGAGSMHVCVKNNGWGGSSIGYDVELPFGSSDGDDGTKEAVDGANNRKRTAQDGDQRGDEKKSKRDKEEDIVPEAANRYDWFATTGKDSKEANNNDTQLRKRKISEKNEALKKHVIDVKNKMRESERRQKYTAWIPYLIGGTVLLTACGVAVYYMYR